MRQKRSAEASEPAVKSFSENCFSDNLTDGVPFWEPPVFSRAGVRSA